MDECKSCGKDMDRQWSHWDGCHTSHPECAAFKAGREAGIMEAANEVPSNWCDQLLTGPNGIGKPPWDCRHITNFLNNLRRNILAAIGEGK